MLRPHSFNVFALTCQDDVDQATSIEELEKQIEKLAKVCLWFTSAVITLVFINKIKVLVWLKCENKYDTQVKYQTSIKKSL